MPAAAFQGKLARVVTLDGLEKIDPHNWLYSTGRPHRYNPAGTDCVYFSETQEVAQMGFDSYWQGMPGEFQPVATYHAEVSLSRVLDLDPLLSTQVSPTDGAMKSCTRLTGVRTKLYFSPNRRGEISVAH